VENLHSSALRHSRTGFGLSPSVRPFTTQFSNRYSGIRISSNSHHRNTYATSNRYKTRVLHPECISGTRFSYAGCTCGASVSDPPPLGGRRLYSSFQSPAPSLQILIANPRLKFLLTHSKFSPLRISNRERIAISRTESIRDPLASNPQNPYTGPSAEGESSWKPPLY
jgi:hypothetical protein